MEKEIIATINACLSDVSLITLDRINALIGSHGSLNIAGLSAANAIIEEILLGKSIKLMDANAPEISIDKIIKKSVKAALKAGATPANAALITALILYFSGTPARAGLPVANRKLGALCRIHAGANRGGVINIPTPKMGNRITAFPAVKAIYDAIAEKKLTQVNPLYIPLGVAGGGIYGHNSLGEDTVFPEIAKNGAKLAVKAMMDAYMGVGLPPSPIICAVLGAAATLEIGHPEANIGEEYGPFGTDTAYVVGRYASRTAGLPRKLYIRGTNQELDTSRVIGDLGLIFKDIGTPTVVGMMFFNDFLWCLEEGLSGAIMPNSVGPINSTLAHVTVGDIIPTMKNLIKYNGNIQEAATTISKLFDRNSFDPEIKKTSIYIVSRKAEDITKGLVTSTLIRATEGTIINAIYRRAKRAYYDYTSGKTIENISRIFDEEKKEKTEQAAEKMFSDMFNRKVKMKLSVRPQSRRTDEMTKKYWSFDSYVGSEIQFGDKIYNFDGLCNNVVPNAVLNKNVELNIPIMISCIAVQELMYSGCCILNIIVPAVIGTLLGSDLKEASKKATKGAWINNSVPGAEKRIKKITQKALNIYNNLKD
jgi:hypothetical protein